jgi:hypothetical protein
MRVNPGLFYWFVCYTVLFTSPAWGGETRELFPAFPGAEGAGAYTLGGRGGKVLLVTTLEDYDPRRENPIAGSLRKAILTKGPRIIVFRVAGNIELKRDLTIDEPFVMIAGQSAPGGGICLKNFTLEIDTHDVVLRHIRIRPGDVEKGEPDGISCNGHNVIIDHCSASWAIDEVLSTNGDSANVTVQWCMITESLNRSTHHKGAHGYGSLISGPGEITYHHNVYAYHRSRNPRVGDVLLDFRNNLIYGWGDKPGYSGDERIRLNYVGNILRPLPYSNERDYAFLPGGLHQTIYIAMNRLEGSAERTRDNRLLIRPPKGSAAKKVREKILASHPFPASEVTTEPADRAYERILKEAGATRPARDAVDHRIMDQIRAGRGGIIDSQADVGGWPALDCGAAPADSDGDGMSDAWEAMYNLDPRQPARTGQDSDGDGFTDIEEFLNGTDPRSTDAWIYPPAVSSSAGDAFVGTTRIKLSSKTPGAEMRYTLDDSPPDHASTLYKDPFDLSQSAILRARSFSGADGSHVRNVSFQRLVPQRPVDDHGVRPSIRFDYYEKNSWRGFPDFSSIPMTESGVLPTVSLAPRKRDFGFGLRFSGFFHAPRNGVYRFHLRCAPRGQIFLHDILVTENEGRRCEHSGAVALEPGLHPFVFQIYYEFDDDKTLAILYEGPSISLQPLGASRLFHFETAK